MAYDVEGWDRSGTNDEICPKCGQPTEFTSDSPSRDFYETVTVRCATCRFQRVLTPAEVADGRRGEMILTVDPSPTGWRVQPLTAKTPTAEETPSVIDDAIRPTTWPPDELKAGPLTFAAFIGTNPEEQPGFGFHLKWNKPGTDHRPFLVVEVWQRTFNIGWFFG